MLTFLRHNISAKILLLSLFLSISHCFAATRTFTTSHQGSKVTFTLEPITGGGHVGNYKVKNVRRDWDGKNLTRQYNKLLFTFSPTGFRHYVYLGDGNMLRNGLLLYGNQSYVVQLMRYLKNGYCQLSWWDAGPKAFFGLQSQLQSPLKDSILTSELAVAFPVALEAAKRHSRPSVIHLLAEIYKENSYRDVKIAINNPSIQLQLKEISKEKAKWTFMTNFRVLTRMSVFLIISFTIISTAYHSLAKLFDHIYKSLTPIELPVASSYPMGIKERIYKYLGIFKNKIPDHDKELILADSIKKKAQSYIEEIKECSLANQKAVTQKKKPTRKMPNIIVYGSYGIGKSTLIRKIIFGLTGKYIDYYDVPGANFTKAPLHEIVNSLDRMEMEAHANLKQTGKSTYVIVDEIDQILTSHLDRRNTTREERTIATKVLTLIPTQESDKLVFIGTTNLPLDDPEVRKRIGTILDRFEVIHMQRPSDLEHKFKIFNLHLKKYAKERSAKLEVDVELIEGLEEALDKLVSGRQIRGYAKRLITKTLRNKPKAKEIKITTDDIQERLYEEQQEEILDEVSQISEN